MQLEWAKHIEGNVLIVSPLSVAEQTVEEGKKFDVELKYCRSQEEIEGKITITNYEMLDHFNPEFFTGVVLDESSILKSFTGKIRAEIINKFKNTKFKLACTATPAPNDYMELGNHAEFLNVMTRTEMLSMYFINDCETTQKWRLKGHAETEYWKWLCSWAVMLREPADLGYNNGEFVLPELRYHHIVVKTDKRLDGELFIKEAQSLQERQNARKITIIDRVNKTSELTNNNNDTWLIWCNLNEESSLIKKHVNNCFEISGSDTREYKKDTMIGFSHGNVTRLVTKPKIAGFGMNWQHCNKIIYVGLSDSYEEFYQSVRRCWRFGQKKPVDVYIITADIEGAVLKNIKRKDEDAKKMAENMVKNMCDINKANIKESILEENQYTPSVYRGDGFTLYHGDCVEEMKNIKDNSIHYSIFSPPFADLYTYSNSERDMGNSRNENEFFEHFRFLIKELYRVIIPGRLVSFHCMDLPTSKYKDGFIGIKDFSGDLIRAFQKEGFIYHSKVVIWKDPLIAAVRTKAIGLMHKQLCKDSALSRQGLPDYLITMRKPGENPEPINNGDGFTEYHGEKEIAGVGVKFSHNIWRSYASPVWMDINASDTLQKESAREDKDEKHICPLQLDVIKRGLQLWSSKGDIILSPFAGIGSEGVISLQEDRKFIGIELKESYFKQAKINLLNAKKQLVLF